MSKSSADNALRAEHGFFGGTGGRTKMRDWLDRQWRLYPAGRTDRFYFASRDQVSKKSDLARTAASEAPGVTVKGIHATIHRPEVWDDIRAAFDAPP